MKCLILLLAALLLMKPAALEPKTVFRVAVSVGSNDEATQALVESYIKRELRSLGDVKVVEADSDWNIEVSCGPTQNVQGIRTGYVAGFAFSRRHVVPPYLIRANISSRMRTEHLSPVYAFEGVSAVSTGTEGLKWMCEVVVARFEADCLEQRR